MAYTIKEVERITKVSAHTIRYWAKCGLFSHIERDANNVRYFSQRDIQWVGLCQCMRESGMGIAKIKEFVELCKQGEKSIPARLEMLKEQEREILKILESYKRALGVVRKKISTYEEMLQSNQQMQGQDVMNIDTKEMRDYYQKDRKYKSLKDSASAKKRVKK